MSVHGYKPKWKKAPWVGGVNDRRHVPSALGMSVVRAPEGSLPPGVVGVVVVPGPDGRPDPRRSLVIRRSRVRPVSKVKAAEKARYRRHARAFVKGKPSAKTRTEAATQVHHQRGRQGALLMDKRWWIPVSAADHDWIHRNPERARRTFAFLTDGRQLMLMCAKGDWNRTDDL